jgi:hypothetical protein
MAQTVAAQRGSTTVAGTGIAFLTLFTQSTGVATRVILNTLSARHDGSTLSRLALLINVNGSGNYSLVALKAGSSANRTVYSINMMPGSSYQPVGSAGNSSTNFYGDRWVIQGTQANRFVGTDIQNNRWELYGPEGIFQSSTGVSIDYVPSQFWMNNGDTLSLLAYNSNEYTTNIVYSFTTITET